ncbi:fiber 2 [White sturgeon adenovirus 1]|uniref:Fiber 2 n=1 Tax=White sturgeon adenovirus 1 TaxID=2580388 RepID=A0A4P8PK62_9ADEN|nr:fiber 2 [White sturgeon adenovirus 1]QCQ84146.1 fiber 2 [White sturgeon adenovirus 1]
MGTPIYPYIPVEPKAMPPFYGAGLKEEDDTMTLMMDINTDQFVLTPELNLKSPIVPDKYRADLSKFYVIAIGGSSNGVGYGCYEKPVDYSLAENQPDPRIFQLGRFGLSSPSDEFNFNYIRNVTPTTTGYGLNFNKFRTFDDANLKLIPAMPCLDHAQNMFEYSALSTKFKKKNGGTVGYGLYVAKRLLPYIPSDYNILLVPCAFGESGFVQPPIFPVKDPLVNGQYDAVRLDISNGTDNKSPLWGADLPIAKQMIDRIKYVLNLNPLNKLMGILWTEGVQATGQKIAQHLQSTSEFVTWSNVQLAPISSQLLNQKVNWIFTSGTKYTYAQNFIGFRRKYQPRLMDLSSIYGNYAWISNNIGGEFVDLSITTLGGYSETDSDINANAFNDTKYFSAAAMVHSVSFAIAQSILVSWLDMKTEYIEWGPEFTDSNSKCGPPIKKTSSGRFDILLDNTDSLFCWLMWDDEKQALDTNFAPDTAVVKVHTKVERPTSAAMIGFISVPNYARNVLNINGDSPVTEYISVSLLPPANFEVLTAHIAFKIDNITNVSGADAEVLISIEHIDPKRQGYLKYACNDEYSFRLNFEFDNVESQLNVYGTEGLGAPTGVWNSLTVIVDMVSDNMRMFFNGSILEGGSLKKELQLLDIKRFTIGALDGGSNGTAGYISEVRLYDKMLTEEEVANLHAMTVSNFLY